MSLINGTGSIFVLLCGTDLVTDFGYIIVYSFLRIMVPLFLILMDNSSGLITFTSYFWGFSKISFAYYFSLSNSFFFSSGLSSDFSFSIKGYFSITYSFFETFTTGATSTLALYTVILLFKMEGFKAFFFETFFLETFFLETFFLEIFFLEIFSLEIFCLEILVFITCFTITFEDYFFFLI